MADYKRLVSYIYAYPGGVRDKNVGFAKAEVRNGQFAKQPPKKKQGKEKGAWLSVAVFYIVLVVVLLFVAIMLSV